MRTVKYNLSFSGKDQSIYEGKTDLRTLKQTVLIFGPYKGRVALVLLSILVTVALTLVPPLMLSLIIDDGLAHRNILHLLIYAAIAVGSASLSGLVGVGKTYMSNIVGQYVMRDLRNKLYAHLQNMSLNFFTSMRTGEIQSRLSNDMTGVQVSITE